MCTTCGCPEADHQHDRTDTHHHPYHGQGKPVDLAARQEGGGRISVAMDILARNNLLAAGNRQLFHQKGILALNLVSSPGSGKTTLLERTLRDLAGSCPVAVIEGDQQTDNDARRIAATGVPVHQVNTGAGCHLDAHMVCHALEKFDLDVLKLLFIENVGNLVCPASFDLGEKHKVVVLSVTEGEDKPLKYPQIFHAATVMLLNKIDLLPHLDFDLHKCLALARQVNPDVKIFPVSAKTGAGMTDWYDWLQREASERVGSPGDGTPAPQGN